VTGYDSLGESHQLTAVFTKGATDASGNTAWTVEVDIPDADLSAAAVAAGTAGTTANSVQLALTPSDNGVAGAAANTQTIYFDQNGHLITTAAEAGADATAVPVDSMSVAITGLSDGATSSGPQTLNWKLTSGAGNGLLTQYAQTSASSAVTCDGNAAAQLTSVGIQNGGNVVAQFSNGSSLIVAQLAMASVVNPESLSNYGDNSYQVTAQTSTPSIGVPGTGGRGNIVGSALESSTVDLATQFTNLLTYQRGYEAASKVITATDQLAQETIGIIR
jgi:flagellar hook protein FlgE